MSKKQEAPNDVFTQFILDNAPRKDGKSVGYKTITEACLENPHVNRINLYQINHRGIVRLDTMMDFVEDFGIDTDVFLLWLSARIKDGTYSRRKRSLISKVS